MIYCSVDIISKHLLYYKYCCISLFQGCGDFFCSTFNVVLYLCYFMMFPVLLKCIPYHYVKNSNSINANVNRKEEIQQLRMFYAAVNKISKIVFFYTFVVDFFSFWILRSPCLCVKMRISTSSWPFRFLQLT